MSTLAKIDIKLTIDTMQMFRVLADSSQLQKKSAGKEFLDQYGLAFSKILTRRLEILWHSHDVNLHLVQGTPVPFHFFYFARYGARFDGHMLCQRVIESKNFFVGEKNRTIAALERTVRVDSDKIQEIMESPFFVEVEDTLTALSFVLEDATFFHEEQWPTVAVTGTNGKTSVTQIVGDLWSRLQQKPIVKIGTLGIQLGHETFEGSHPTMPDYPSFLHAAAFCRRQGAAGLVMEATSQGLVEGRMGRFRASIALFTNLTEDHLDFHKTMDEYRDAKILLFVKHLQPKGIAIVHTGDKNWPLFATAAVATQSSVIGFGPTSERSAFFNLTRALFVPGRYIEFTVKGTSVRGIQGIWRLTHDPDGEIQEEAMYESSLCGSFQHENLTAAAAALVGLGFSLNEILTATSATTLIPGRLQLVRPDLQQGPGNNTKAASSVSALPSVFVDYAHSPDALKKALQSCRSLLPNDNGKLWCVFGCGGDRDRLKRPIMGGIAARMADYVIVTSDNPRTEAPEQILDDIISGASIGNVAREVDRARAIEQAVIKSGKNDIVLIAGKGHEDYQIVGHTKFPFSDVESAKKVLESRLMERVDKEM